MSSLSDFHFVIRHTGNSSYVVLVHRPCKTPVGSPGDMQKAMQKVTEHRCSIKKRSD